MSYQQWKSLLFEESWPRLKFEGGSLSWQKDETLLIQWGDATYNLDVADMYSPDTEPIDSVILWCQKNLPLRDDEHANAHIWWSSPERSFRASVVRPGGSIYTQAVNVTDKFTQFGKSIRGENFDWKLSGGVMMVSSLIKGVPALCPLSHPSTFADVCGEYFEPSESILIAFSPQEKQHAFIGHKDVVMRIRDEDRGFLALSSSEWNADITHALEKIA